MKKQRIGVTKPVTILEHRMDREHFFTMTAGDMSVDFFAIRAYDPDDKGKDVYDKTTSFEFCINNYSGHQYIQLGREHLEALSRMLDIYVKRIDGIEAIMEGTGDV